MDLLLLLGVGFFFWQWQTSQAVQMPVNPPADNTPLPVDFGVTGDTTSQGSFDPTAYTPAPGPDYLTSSLTDQSNLTPVNYTPAVIGTVSHYYNYFLSLFQSQTKWDAIFADAENKLGLPSGILKAMAAKESHFDPSLSNPSGAVGLMQLMPKFYPTAGQNPVQDIYTAAAAMRGYYNRFGNYPDALGSYNWSPTKIARYGLVNAPIETTQYVADIMTMTGLA